MSNRLDLAYNDWLSVGHRDLILNLEVAESPPPPLRTTLACSARFVHQLLMSSRGQVGWETHEGVVTLLPVQRWDAARTATHICELQIRPRRLHQTSSRWEYVQLRDLKNR